MLEIKAIGFPATVQAVVSRTSRMRRVSIVWNISGIGGHIMFNLHNINRMGEQKVCAHARSSKMYYNMCVSGTIQGNHLVITFSYDFQLRSIYTYYVIYQY